MRNTKRHASVNTDIRGIEMRLIERFVVCCVKTNIFQSGDI